MSGVNLGFEQAEGEIVVLSDASPHYEANALNMLVRCFSDPSVGVVVGKLALWDAENSVAKSAGLYWKYEAMLRKWESQTGSTVAVHGNMFAIRREAFRTLTESTINDEFSLAMEAIRQGFRVIYEPEAISYDDASNSMKDEFNRRVRINAGRYQAMFSAGYLKAPTLNMAFRLISHKLIRPLVPVFLLFLFGLNAVALILSNGDSGGFPIVLASSWAAFLMVGQVSFYGFAWLGYRQEGKRKRLLLLNVPYYFVSTNLAALLGLWRWLSGKQRVTWQKRTVSNGK
jgi:cellulose synthase/poly-beta-1,6-N-acetylglucosamine synthase-like glycosyltransferase